MGVKMYNNQRLYWIDIAKGALLFLVILGHLVTYNSYAFAFIFAFHMPAFFFLSGYTLNVKNTKFALFLKKKCCSLLIPYLVFGAVAFCLSLLVPPTKTLEDIVTKTTLENFFWYGQPSHGAGATWFLISLFCAQILVYVLVHINKKWISITVTVVSGVLGMYVKEILWHFESIKLPWNISITLVAFPFVIFGYYFKEKKLLQVYQESDNHLLTYVIFLISLSMIFVFGCDLNSPVNMGSLTYGNPIYYWIGAFWGIIMIISFSLILKRNKFLEFYGRNSLIIFALQAYVYNFLIYIVNKIFETDYIKMKNIPNVLCFILAIITFLIWGLIVKIINGIKNRLVKICRNI